MIDRVCPAGSCGRLVYGGRAGARPVAAGALRELAARASDGSCSRRCSGWCECVVAEPAQDVVGAAEKLGGIGERLGYYAGDPVENVNVTMQPAVVSGDTAYVSIDSLETVGAATGCKHWTCTYTLARGVSGWRIERAKLPPTSC